MNQERYRKEFFTAMSAYAILLVASINAIETEKYDPSLPRAFLIAKLFGKTIEEIFFPQKT